MVKNRFDYSRLQRKNKTFDQPVQVRARLYTRHASCFLRVIIFYFWSLREFGEKVCFGSPTKHFVIFDLADMFRLDVKETPILRKIYVKYTSTKHQFDAEST